VTIGLLLMTGLQVDTSYGNLVWRLMIMAVGMGLTMAPATESVMGSLPLGKAGVGSAVNDTTRQVGGALGVAIIGSVMSSVYGSKVADWFDSVSNQVPAGSASQFAAAKEAAESQIGAALRVAQQLPDRQLANQLVSTANEAFVTALHYGVVVGAAATAVGAVVAFVWLPAHATREDVEEQDHEYAEEMAAARHGEVYLEPASD
jgi:hypothetical protein